MSTVTKVLAAILLVGIFAPLAVGVALVHGPLAMVGTLFVGILIWVAIAEKKNSPE